MAVPFTEDLREADSTLAVVAYSSFIIVCLVMVVSCSSCSRKKKSAQELATKDEHAVNYDVARKSNCMDDDGYYLPEDLPENPKKNGGPVPTRTTLPRSLQSDKEKVCIIREGTLTRVAIEVSDNEYQMIAPPITTKQAEVEAVTIPSIQNNKQKTMGASELGLSSCSLQGSSHHPPNKPFSYTEGRQPIKDSQVSYYNQDNDNLTGSSIKTRTMVFDDDGYILPA